MDKSIKFYFYMLAFCSISLNAFCNSSNVEVSKVVKVGAGRTFSNISYSGIQLYYFGKNGMVEFDLGTKKEKLLLDAKNAKIGIKYRNSKRKEFKHEGKGIRFNSFGRAGTLKVNHAGKKIAFSSEILTPDDKKRAAHESIFIMDLAGGQVMEMFTDKIEENIKIKYVAENNKTTDVNMEVFKYSNYNLIGWSADDSKVVYLADRTDRSGSAILSYDLNLKKETVHDEGGILIASIQNNGNKIVYSKIENNSIVLVISDLIMDVKKNYQLKLIRPIWGYDDQNIFEGGDTVFGYVDLINNNHKKIFDIENSNYKTQSIVRDDGKSKTVKMLINNAIWPLREELFFVSRGEIYRMDLSIKD